MEALVEVQRWLFSSLFCLALSLSFPPFLPFSSVLPELLSSQINSPPCFLFSSKILPPRFVPLFLKKTSSLSFLFFPPSLYKQEEKVSPLLCPIVVQGGNGLPYLCRVRWPAVFAGHGVPFLAGYGFIGMGFVQVGGERGCEK